MQRPASTAGRAVRADLSTSTCYQWKVDSHGKRNRLLTMMVLNTVHMVRYTGWKSWMQPGPGAETAAGRTQARGLQATEGRGVVSFHTQPRETLQKSQKCNIRGTLMRLLGGEWHLEGLFSFTCSSETFSLVITQSLFIKYLYFFI